jgi:hypothetical protein
MAILTRRILRLNAAPIDWTKPTNSVAGIASAIAAAAIKAAMHPAPVTP